MATARERERYFVFTRTPREGGPVGVSITSDDDTCLRVSVDELDACLDPVVLVAVQDGPSLVELQLGRQGEVDGHARFHPRFDILSINMPVVLEDEEERESGRRLERKERDYLRKKWDVMRSFPKIRPRLWFHRERSILFRMREGKRRVCPKEIAATHFLLSLSWPRSRPQLAVRQCSETAFH
jgi:hypothetical protein